MYLLRFKILVRESETSDWKNASSYESESLMDYNSARHALTRAGQSIFRTLLELHGLGNVFYAMPADRVRQRELVLPNENRMHRIEIVRA